MRVKHLIGRNDQIPPQPLAPCLDPRQQHGIATKLPSSAEGARQMNRNIRATRETPENEFEHFTWDVAAQRTFDRYLDLFEMRPRATERSLIGADREMARPREESTETPAMSVH